MAARLFGAPDARGILEQKKSRRPNKPPAATQPAKLDFACQ